MIISRRRRDYFFTKLNTFSLFFFKTNGTICVSNEPSGGKCMDMFDKRYYLGPDDDFEWDNDSDEDFVDDDDFDDLDEDDDEDEEYEWEG